MTQTEFSNHHTISNGYDGNKRNYKIFRILILPNYKIFRILILPNYKIFRILILTNYKIFRLE